MDVQDLGPALLFGKTDLYLNLKTAWAEESVVHHVSPAVRHHSCCFVLGQMVRHQT